MGYIQRSLADGERIVYRTRMHPVIFVWPALLFFITYTAFQSGFEGVAQILLAFACITAFVVISTYLRSEFAVTSRRVLGKLAFGYNPEYPEVELIELHDAEFKPGLLSSLFDYGTLIITDREGRRHKFSGVPAEFYEHVQARNERARRALS
jgi:hypothetical protein